MTYYNCPVVKLRSQGVSMFLNEEPLGGIRMFPFPGWENHLPDMLLLVVILGFQVICFYYLYLILVMMCKLNGLCMLVQRPAVGLDVWNSLCWAMQFAAAPGMLTKNAATYWSWEDQRGSWVSLPIPSGKHTKNYGKSPFLMGKSTINGKLT